MNKKLLYYLIGFLSVLLASTAAFFSIAGLSKLFAGASTPVIIMASSLEISKLIIASFLYRYWKTVSIALKSYLLIATVIIMTITSIGIYGFLSSAYQNTKNSYDLSSTFTDSLNSKKLYYETYVSTYQKQIGQQNERLNQLNSIRNSQENRLNNQTGSSYQNTKSSRLTDNQIEIVSKDIDRLNKIVLQYTDSINKLTVAATQSKLKNNLTSDLGPLQFISGILNVPMDSVVNILIILFIVVFDPLAICLVLAYNFMKSDFESSDSEKNEKLSNLSEKDTEEKIKDDSEKNFQIEEIEIEEDKNLITDDDLEDTQNFEKISEEIESKEGDKIPQKIIEEHKSEDEIIDEFPTSLAEEELSVILDEPVFKNHSDSVSGYYGDVPLDGNGVFTQEGEILPVNANKKKEAIDESSKVSINPTRL